MLNDIITEHKERMLNLKKYYPFFKLMDVSFAQFQEGRYEMLDMGYIVMGILRFFIEENNFKEKDVTYPEYLDFITSLLKRDFGLNLSAQEYKELADYIFDKIKNEGRPFTFPYYDPIEKKKCISRIKVLESAIRDHTVWYSISSDAIEFYLDTKEIKEESRISVQQLLLEKMIQAQNFQGGKDVIVRINEEVARLQRRKNEIMELLGKDVFAGIEAYEDFVHTGMRWFDEEEKLFKKNKDFIEGALAKMEAEPVQSESYYRTLKEIYELDSQLQIAMTRHGQLLSACTQMQQMTEEAVKRAKLGRLRSHIHFGALLTDLIRSDNAGLLEQLLSPVLLPHIKKRFTLDSLDEALTVKPKQAEAAEKVEEEPPQEIQFADEMEDQRIRKNYTFLMNNLLAAFEKRDTFTLSEFGAAMSRMYSPDILKNADYYSFFVNLCQKQEYVIGGQTENESFLDDILSGAFADREPVHFTITPKSAETVSEQGTNAALYQEYSTNPEVYDMVLLSLKKMELSVYEYNNSLFAAPKAHGSLFGYSNEALRRELGLRTNGELYLAYFIIYNIIMEFYTDTISATYAEFVRVEDIVRKVDDTTAGIVDKKNGFVLSEIEENSFRSLALSWDSLPAATVELSELRAAKNSKSGFVKLVCNFLVSQQLLSDNQERYYPTDRFRAVVENYFDESRGRIMELLDQSGEERDEHAAD